MNKLLTEFLTAQRLCIRVKAEQNTLVDQRVLLLRPRPLVQLGLCRANHGLDLVTVNKPSDVRIGDLGSR
jgi:hypothetical protein